MPLPRRAQWKPWTDPICLAAWGAYCFNRFWMAPHFGEALPFLREHFNDSLLIPAALPLLHWARFRLGLREQNTPPTWREVLPWCAVWSLLFEWAGPRFLHRSVGDWGDVAAYFIGGIVAATWWHFGWNRGKNREVKAAKEGGRTRAAPLS